MKSLNNYIKESVINEGPGAGYSVTFEGLQIDPDSIKLRKEVGKEETKIKKDIRYFEAKLKKCVLKKWSAEGYDWYISSDGVEYDGDVVDEYDESHRTVKGGIVEGYIYLEDVDFREDEEDRTPKTDERDIIDFIINNLDNFDIDEYMYGGGYLHSSLGKPIELCSERKPAEVETPYSLITLDRLQIDADKITDDIEWYHDNYYQFDKIFGDEED